MNKFLLPKTLFLALALFVMSCDDEKKVPKVDQDLINLEDKFIVEIEAIILKDDVLELFYKTSVNDYYKAEQSVSTAVTGDNKTQLFQFILGQQIYPFSLRLDLGSNKTQEIIRIKKISLKYNDGKHEFTSDEVERYFVPNKYINFNFTEMIAEPKVIEGKYDPYLASHNISKFVNKLILY